MDTNLFHHYYHYTLTFIIFAWLTKTSAILPPVKPDYALSPVHMKKLIQEETHVVHNCFRPLAANSTSQDHVTVIVTQYLHEYGITFLPDLGINLTMFFNLMDLGIVDLGGFSERGIKNPLKIYKTLRRVNLWLRLLIRTNAVHLCSGHDVRSPCCWDEVDVPIPTDKDGMTSVLNILGLLQIYDIPFKNLIEGRVGNVTSPSPGLAFSPYELLELCQIAKDNKLYLQAIECYNTIWEEEGWPDLFRTKANLEMEKLIKAHDEKLKDPLEPFKDLQTDSGLPLFSKPLESEDSVNFHGRIPMRLEDVYPNHENLDMGLDPTLQVVKVGYMFQNLCRSRKGPLEINSWQPLSCYVTSKPHIAFTLSPLKVEVHHDSPMIIEFHNFLGESEIDAYKSNGSLEGLYGSKTISKEGFSSGADGNLVKNRLRTSSNTWVHDHPGTPGSSNNSSSVFTRVLGRIGRASGGLRVDSPRSSESMLVAAYNPGGHYSPHFDPVIKPGNLNPQDVMKGDRIVTFMIYLSDVEEGGHTVFPLLGIRIPPRKGSALMWYNLRQDGEIDHLMLHGSCGVIHGVKWIANKWIRYGDQFCTRMCPKMEVEGAEPFPINIYI